MKRGKGENVVGLEYAARLRIHASRLLKQARSPDFLDYLHDLRVVAPLRQSNSFGIIQYRVSWYGTSKQPGSA